MPDYRIASVARLTGLPADTIRKWERRYTAVKPRRDANGIRRYTEDDLKRLRDLRAAVDLGCPISEAAALPPAALATFLANKAAQPAATRSRERRDRTDTFARTILRGLERYDGEQIDRMLNAASHLLTPSEFVFEVMSPLFKRIGDAWRAGSMEIAQEHLFSAVARSLLGSLIRRYPSRSDAPPMIFTTPTGEPHEFGVLLAAMLAASEGQRVQYLGPDMRAKDIVLAAEQARAGTVVLAAVRSASKHMLSRSIAALATGLPTNTQLWLGGKAAAHVHSGGSTNVVALATLEDFYRRLRDQQHEG